MGYNHSMHYFFPHLFPLLSSLSSQEGKKCPISFHREMMIWCEGNHAVCWWERKGKPTSHTFIHFSAYTCKQWWRLLRSIPSSLSMQSIILPDEWFIKSSGKKWLFIIIKRRKERSESRGKNVPLFIHPTVQFIFATLDFCLREYVRDMSLACVCECALTSSPTHFQPFCQRLLPLALKDGSFTGRLAKRRLYPN